MLQLLKSFDDIDQGPDTAHKPSVVDIIDRRHLILKSVFAAHCLLDVRFALGPQAYQTVIIELVPEAGYLVLDALTPPNGDAHTTNRPTINVRTQMRGIELKFQSVITQRGVVDGAPFYQIPYPEAIDYPQRREEYRVTGPFDKSVAVRIHARDGSIMAGEVRDLSPSGFLARIPNGDPSIFEAPETRSTVCEIDLPGHGTLAAAVEICHVFARRGRAPPRVGVCFIDLDLRTERQIEHCVAKLDRQQSRLR